MAERLVISVTEDEKREIEAMADNNPFTRGNVSAFIRGLIQKEKDEREKSGKRVVMVQGLNGPAVVDPEFGNK